MRLPFPVDGTFLSLITHEGILSYYEFNRSIVDAIKELGENIEEEKEYKGNKIFLSGNDLTVIELPRKPLKKEKEILELYRIKKEQLIEYIQRRCGELGMTSASEEDLWKNFIKEEISNINLEEVENFYNYFIRIYSPSDYWVSDEQFLERYLKLPLGAKIIWMGKIKKEFEFLQDKNKFDKFKKKLIEHLHEILNNRLNQYIENIIPCIFPTYVRIGFPEQFLEEAFSEEYTKKKILKMALEKEKKKKKGSGTKKRMTKMVSEESFEEQTYSDVVSLFQTIYKKISKEYNFNSVDYINIDRDDENGKIFIHTSTLNKQITAPQILKCDRYTGFSTLEGSFFTKQYTLYISPDLALLYIIGLVRSLILRKRQQQEEWYYFLLFSPDEITRLYSKQDTDSNSNLIRKYFIIKDKAVKILRTAHLTVLPSEIAIMELALNLELQNEMNKHNLDKISFILFKVAREGNAYKIYEQTLLTLYRRIVFRDIVEKYFRNSEKFIRNLSTIFEKRNKPPYRVLWDTLKSLNEQEPEVEANNALRAMMGLYRFVILGDSQGYYQFMRELHNCYKKAETEGNEKKSRAYRQILNKLKVS